MDNFYDVFSFIFCYISQYGENFTRSGLKKNKSAIVLSDRKENRDIEREHCTP